MLRLTFFAALSILATAADAQVYKCVDASGKIAYLQSPCPTDARGAKILRAVPPAPAAPAADGAAGGAAKSSGPKTAAELEQDFRKRRQEQEGARKKEEEKLAEAKNKEQNCSNARQRLASIDGGLRQTGVSEKGERYFLDDAQITQERANAQKAAEQWCN